MKIKRSFEATKNMRKSPIWKNIDLYVKQYKSGLTISEVAEKNNVNKNTLKTCFKRYGVKTRSTGSRKGRIPWNKGKPYLQIKGPKNPRWKGGITPLNQKIRHCFKYKQWIKSIFERDNYTCVKCNKRGGNIEADHYPIKFSDIIKLCGIINLDQAEKTNQLWDINNGRTLCLKCHNRTKQVRSRFKKFNSNNM